MLEDMTEKTTRRGLVEAAKLLGEAAREDGAWKVRLISEGQGSSGFYSRELLEGYHSVLDDVLSFKNHPGEWDGPETRDFTMIVGEIVGETWIEDDERGMASIVGWYLPDPEYRDKIERYKGKLGVSIYAMGEGEFDENTGNFKVTSFEADPYNSLDVVIAAGARGKFLESMRRAYAHRVENASAASAEGKTNKEEELTEMELKDLGEEIASLTTAFRDFVESQKKSIEAEAESATAEEAAKAAVEAYDAQTQAIADADLLPTQAESLRKQAREGKDVSAQLEDAKLVAKEAKEQAAKTIQEGDRSDAGRFAEGAATSGYKLSGFGQKGA